MSEIKKLLKKISIEKVKEQDNVYIGKCNDIGFSRVFGGQVIAQALSAAQKTTTRQAHSLHCYFIREGNLQLDIHYHVTIIRDGKSFSVRQVLGQQNNQCIFIMHCSFHEIEDGGPQQIPTGQLARPTQENTWLFSFPN